MHLAQPPTVGREERVAGEHAEAFWREEPVVGAHPKVRVGLPIGTVVIDTLRDAAATSITLSSHQ